MTGRGLVALIMTVAVVGLATPVSAQSGAPEGWTAPRTADGQPDLQGIWANNRATPMERPEQFGEKATLSDEELAELTQQIQAFRDAEQAGDLLGDRLIQQALGNSTFQDFDAETGNYNAFWLVERELDNRTSLIIDPPNGRRPPMTPEAQERADARRAYSREHPSDGPEDRGHGDRCLHFDAPRLGSGYNSYSQILQTPTHVAILEEMGHQARVIPLDQRSHPADDLRLWHGSARGHWDGDTLVIESRGFSAESGFSGATENVRLVERISRVGPNTLRHEVTIDDQNTWTSPWTVELLKEKEEGAAIFEYACHEGNYALPGILGGARVEEQAAR